MNRKRRLCQHYMDLVLAFVRSRAKLLQRERVDTPRSAAWYVESESTFIDATVLARRHLWFATETFSTSASSSKVEKVSVQLFNRLVESLAYAA